MRTVLAVAMVIGLTATTAAAQTVTPPQQIKLASSLYPEPELLGKDTLQCARLAGFETTEQLEKLVSWKPESNPDAMKKFRAMATWIECMNVRGYVVPMQ